MYISKWWGNFVGGSDDSLLLLDYFGKKESGNLNLKEILKDLHLDTVLSSDTAENGDLFFEPEKGYTPHFDMAIDVIIDLSAIVLECLHNEKVDIKELDKSTKYNQMISIVTDKEDIQLLKKGLDKFITSPQSFELSHMMDVADLSDLIKDCYEISTAFDAF